MSYIYLARKKMDVDTPKYRWPIDWLLNYLLLTTPQNQKATVNVAFSYVKNVIFNKSIRNNKGRKKPTKIHATEKMNTHVVRWWLPEANRFKQYLSNGVKIGTGWRFSTSPSQCEIQPHPNPHRIAPRIVLVAFNASMSTNVSPIAK
ncbi:hypothetical protein AL552_08380 (plasmid) [Vibrio diabolicus]|nr:hypothetical protein AL552_08380 [Vibrio diabolicus]OKQ16064.1 hypothetical protein H058_05545 [Vibrio antiquarius]